MMIENLDELIREAVKHFWQTRLRQSELQGRKTGLKDHGRRSAVTGGAQLDGFINLVARILTNAGLPETAIIRKKSAIVPGFFRPTKEWDLIVVFNKQLLAAIEFKSQVGPSFGNNFNNRAEESIGSAVDIKTAYRDGVFCPSPRPWLGYFFILEKAAESIRTVSVDEPHFEVLPEFKNTSYLRRYELLCTKLLREGLYDAACLLISSQEDGIRGEYEEVNPELSFNNFILSLTGRAIAFTKLITQQNVH